MRILVALLLVSVALAGCGDKGDAAASFTTPDKEDGVYVITIGSTGMEPENAKVPKESIVEWRVVGTGCHIVADDGAFDSTRSQGSGTTFHNGIVPAGQSYRWIADATGEHPYKCAGRSVSGTLRVG